MRPLLAIAALLLFAGSSFAQEAVTSPVDIKAEKEALNKLIDKFSAATETLDVSTMLSLFTEDARIYGTDPEEFWTKEEFSSLVEQGSPGSAPEIRYINDREIIIGPTGNSAIVVTQYLISWSPNIPWRQVFYCAKVEDKWMIHFMNVAFIPKNEDIQKINNALV